MADQKVALEVAEADFERMCKARRLKTVDADWTEEEQKTFANLRKDICAAICDGLLEVDGDDDPVLKPTGAAENCPKSIKIKKARGSTLLAMNGKAEAAKIFAAFADMGGIHASHFANMQLWDIDLVSRLFVLFFASR